MGVDGLLGSLIAGTDGETTSLETLRDLFAGVDASLLLMKWQCTSEDVGAWMLMEPWIDLWDCGWMVGQFQVLNG